MASKPRLFSSSFYYHVYNRGVDKRDIFTTSSDYIRFLETIKYYLRDQRICYAAFSNLSFEDRARYLQNRAELDPTGLKTLRARLFCYCLMPNHFHILVKPVKKDGITVFLADICNSYTRYFNLRNTRQGSLFQGVFKAKVIDSSESLIQASRYIHLNPLFSWQTNFHQAIIHPKDYPYSSYEEWFNPDKPNIVAREDVNLWLKGWGGITSYEEFIRSKIDYSQLAPEKRPTWFIE